MDELASKRLPHHSSQDDLGEQSSLQDEKSRFFNRSLPMKRGMPYFNQY